jgi:hypothetical protein
VFEGEIRQAVQALLKAVASERDLGIIESALDALYAAVNYGP